MNKKQLIDTMIHIHTIRQMLGHTTYTLEEELNCLYAWAEIHTMHPDDKDVPKF